MSEHLRETMSPADREAVTVYLLDHPRGARRRRGGVPAGMIAAALLVLASAAAAQAQANLAINPDGLKLVVDKAVYDVLLPNGQPAIDTIETTTIGTNPAGAVGFTASTPRIEAVLLPPSDPRCAGVTNCAEIVWRIPELATVVLGATYGGTVAMRGPAGRTADHAGNPFARIGPPADPVKSVTYGRVN